MYVSVLLGLFCCLVFLLPLAAAGVAGTGYGPLPTRSQNPLYLQLLALPMEATHTIPPGRVETALHTAFSNVFERDAKARWTGSLVLSGTDIFRRTTMSAKPNSWVS